MIEKIRVDRHRRIKTSNLLSKCEEDMDISEEIFNIRRRNLSDLVMETESLIHVDQGNKEQFKLNFTWSTAFG